MLDLAKFEKVKEDKHTTTMRHKDGHEMTILVAKLPKIHREQLKRLKMAEGGKIQKYADGTPDSPVQAEAIDPSQPENQASPAAPPVQAPANAASISGAANLTPLQQQAQGIVGAGQQQTLGAQEQAQVNANTSQAMAPVLKSQVDSEAQRKAQLVANAAMVKKHTDEFNEWMGQNGSVDPKRFGQSLPVAQKVNTALGLIIGGFAGGFNGTGNNPAMNWLKDQQEKDIASQVQDISNHKNVLGAYQNLFNNRSAAIEATRISDNNKLVQQAAQIAAQQGTLQAKANYDAFAAQKKMENDEHTRTAAGYLTVNPPASAPQTNNPSQQGTPDQQAQAPATGGILSPDAQKKYEQVLYDPTKTPEQKHELQDEYLKGVQVDKALQQIDQLYPDISGKRNFGGWMAGKVDPHIVGGAGLLAAEGLTGGGGGGLGAIPVGMAGVAAGEGIGHAVKQGFTAMGGQQEQQYQTAKAALVGYIGSALQGVQITPSEIGEIADKFTPTYWDSPETIKDKQDKLKEKIKTLTKTGALKAYGMTSD